MPQPTDIDIFNARLRDAQRRLYDCLDYNDQQCQGKLVLLAWVGGKRFEDEPRCTIREYETWWFWLAARSDEPRLRTLKFSVECRKRCAYFAGPWAKAKHRWEGTLAIPVFYGKRSGRTVAFERESICRKSTAKSPQEMLDSHIELVLAGQATPQRINLACTVRVE